MSRDLPVCPAPQMMTFATFVAFKISDRPPACWRSQPHDFQRFAVQSRAFHDKEAAALDISNG
jgi:hypothetical protein